MSSASPRNRKASPYVCGKDTPWQPGDEAVGDYSRGRLVAMNQRFVERVIASGNETRQAYSHNAWCEPEATTLGIGASSAHRFLFRVSPGEFRIKLYQRFSSPAVFDRLKGDGLKSWRATDQR
jgi:hypothetical protein